MLIRHTQNRGSAILEMLLFIPLALLLLFVGLDGALLFNARGAARSAMRDGLNSEQAITQVEGVLTGAFGDSELNLNRAQLVIDNVVARIQNNLNKISPFAVDGNKLKVLGKLYLLEIDTSSGRFIGAQYPDVNSVRPENSPFSIAVELPNFEFRSLDRLELESFVDSPAAHHLAQPIPLAIGSAQRFYPRTVAIGVEVTAIAGGISPGVTQWLLGSYYGIGEAIIVPLRISLS